VGVRQVLMGDLERVAVSVDAALSFAWGRNEASSSFSSGGTTTSTSTVSNGGSIALAAGLAAEHMLTRQLSIRVSLGLLKGGYATGKSALSSNQSVSGFNLGISFDPGVELRLYF
jgi:hypothetical protein